MPMHMIRRSGQELRDPGSGRGMKSAKIFPAHPLCIAGMRICRAEVGCTRKGLARGMAGSAVASIVLVLPYTC